MQIPTFVYFLAPVVIIAFIVQIVFRARSAARSARGLVRSFKNTVAVDRQQPTTGELATALAVGAHMSLNHGVSWNALKDDANSAQKIYANLKNQWGVGNAGELREALDGLLDNETGDPVADFVLDVRQELGGSPTVDRWRDAVAGNARVQGVPETTIDEMTATIDRVLSYEERFRADGLLPAGGVVRSLRAYDWGRAVNMTRWGYSCDTSTSNRRGSTSCAPANWPPGTTRRGPTCPPATRSAGCCASTTTSSTPGTPPSSNRTRP